ncbi:MFS transporter [Cupriavidus basilensis]
MGHVRLADLCTGEGAQRRHCISRWRRWPCSSWRSCCCCAERGHLAPMLPIDLLKRPMFALSTMTAIFSFAAQGLAFVSLPFYFERARAQRHRDRLPDEAPWSAVVALMAPLAGRLSDRYPPGLLGGVGLAVMCMGMASLALLPAHPSALDIGIRMAICGAGFGFFQVAEPQALMSSAPRSRRRQRRWRDRDRAPARPGTPGRRW